MWRKPAEPRPSALPDEPGSQVPMAPGVYPREQVAAQPSVAAPGGTNVTRLTQGITLKGEISGKADLYVDGELEGNVRLGDGLVTVGPNGRVSAEIEAREISVQGTVRGNLRGRQRVLLGRSSRVNGNIETERVVIEEGARFRGKVNLVKTGEARASRAPEPDKENEKEKEKNAPSYQPISVRSREGIQ